MARSHKRQRHRGRAGGVGKAQSRAGQVDHTLRTLLINYLALPTGHTVIINGLAYMSDEASMYSRAIVEREKQLPPGALEAALNSLVPEVRG